MNPHARPPIALWRWLHGLVQHRSLLVMMIRRDVAQRYQGSYLGWLWQLAQPLLMLLVYTYLFAGVFGARWAGTDGGKLQFGLVLYVGLLVHGTFAELVNRAPALVVHHANYVKRVIFPLEILPVMALGTVLYHSVIGFAVLLLAWVTSGAPLHAAVLSVPLVMVPLALFALGMAYGLASLGTFIRDMGQVVAVVTSVLLFVSPVFYPITAVPPAYRPLIEFNPLTYFIETVRVALVHGQWPDAQVWLAWLLASVAVAWLGFVWFQLTRKGFGDVL